MEILISEDDFISRNLLKKMLTELGHDVLETENGGEAWELLQRREIKMVISDWMMPEMDGLELCQKIRSLNQDRYIYVIMLTAKDRKTDLVDVFSAGADDYIPKPFDPEELRARVATGIRVTDLQEQQRQLTGTLIESRNKLMVVLDAIQEEIVSLDCDMTIVSANQSFSSNVQRTPSEVAGRYYFTLAKGDARPDPNDLKAIVQSVFETSNSRKTMLVCNDMYGNERDWQISCVPILDDTGNASQVVIVSQDITEDRRKAAEIEVLNTQLMDKSAQIEGKNETLEKTLKRLEDTQAQMLQSEKMATIGQLAAGVAHEINNPTGFVSSNLKTLSDYQIDIAELIAKYRDLRDTCEANGQSAFENASLASKIGAIKAFEDNIDIEFLLEDIADLIVDCREGTDRIKKIVIDLKDFAHPGEDKIQTIDINNGLDSTLNVVNNEIKYKATVHKAFGDIPPVRGYPQQLNQVFMNILVNAAQAIEKRGEIHIQTREIDNMVEITIRDSGCGISKENLKKIFDPFFTTKDVGKGTGLGMNIAYNIIRKHSGTIAVDSTVGKGTTFTICIPAAGKEE